MINDLGWKEQRMLVKNQLGNKDIWNPNTLKQVIFS